VSDAAGNLLFACDGKTIIDRNLSIVPALKGKRFNSGNDKVLAAKVPGTSKFYIFYSTGNDILRNSPWTIRYAVLDLSLNGGLGDITEYDHVIASNVSQGFTLAQGSATEDIWLITHQNQTVNFLAYKITSTGLSTVPVMSMASSKLAGTEYIFKDLKTSHNGKMIAGIMYRDYTDIFAEAYHYTEVFNFDANAGVLTSRVRSRRNRNYYHSSQTVEFSADDRLLYEGQMDRIYGLQPCGWGGGSVVQYNLCYTDSVDFAKYAMRVAYIFNFCNSASSWGRIQMGADKKIYMPYSGTIISSINNPNRIGSSSNYTFNAHQVSQSNNTTVLAPTFHHREMEKAVKNNIIYNGGCFPNPTHFSITNDTIKNIVWNFGDLSSVGNSSNNLSPEHVFSAPGMYTVSAQLYNSLNHYIETVTELVEIKDPAVRLLNAYPKDTIFCSGQSLKLKLNVVNGIFHWQQKGQYSTFSVGTSDTIQIYSTGTYYVEMRQNDCDGCVMRDSINVVVLPSPYVQLGNDRQFCTGDSIQLAFYDAAADYLWSNGSTDKAVWVKKGGTYWVEAEFNKNGCPQRDTIEIKEVPGVSFSFPNDTTLCAGQTLLLNPNITNANYYWQNNTYTPTQLVNKPGTYWARVSNYNGCTKTDTIHVSYVTAEQVSLGSDTLLCEGKTLTLSTSIANAKYLWSDGSTESNLSINKSGTYWLKVDNGSCTVADTISVVFNKPPTLQLGNDTTLCEKQGLTLQSSIPGNSYKWQDGSTLGSFRVSSPGLYWLQVKKDGCVISDTIQVSFKAVPKINLGRDTAICANETLTLNANDVSIRSYTWQNNSTQPVFYASNAGTYWVKAEGLNGCSNSDTIKVAIQALPNFNLGNDTTLCELRSIKYNLNLPGATYLWSDGSTSSGFNISNAGVYWLEANNGCKKRDTIQVAYKPIPQVNLGKDTTLCEGSSKSLNATYTNARYLWQDKSINSSITVTRPGLYFVSVNLNGCEVKDSIKIDYRLKPRFSLGKDTTLCLGEELVLNPNTNNAGYLWQNGSTAARYIVKNPGIFSVIVTNECGSANDEIIITAGVCQLYMPNAFTPNNDGNNDYFKIKNPGFINTFKMNVYDRWGQLVFTSIDPFKGWDGKFKNTPLPVGNYVWQINLISKDGITETASGSVVLIR
jgi:gliding motility-associated-like protein